MKRPHCMQIALRLSRFLPVVAAFLGAGTSGFGQGATKRTLVEVWRGGDDGLTVRLTNALERALESSPDFTLSSGKKPGSLVITIPTHVGWKQIDGRTQVTYIVEFTSVTSEKVGKTSGSCWDDSLAKCADQIVKEAKIAARNIQ
jgi:hypothetical protein